MPPERNNTVRFSQLSGLAQASLTDIIPIVDTSIPTLVNKKITITGLNQSLPLYGDMTNVKTSSSSWNSVYSTFNSNSGEYESTYSSVNISSAGWNSAYTSVNQNSGNWTGLTTYSTVNSLSNNWNTAYSLASSAYTSFNSLSSGTWVLKAGDQMTGALTTTRTNTASFGLDEFVTKRYADALATASQISGNFVPSLYYTKNDFQTGIPVVSAVLSQFYQATMGSSGSSWSGTITFNPNQFGTDVPAFVFTTANPSIGNRAGIYINSGSSGQFSYSQGTISQNWDGPSFATVYTLSRTGAARLSLYDDINLNGNLNVLGNASTTNLVFDNWRSVLCKSVLALSGSVTTIGDRLALSGNRLAFESGSTQKFAIYPTTNNGLISWGVGSNANTLDVYNAQDFQFTKSGGATHILRCFSTGNIYELQGSNPGGFQWDNGSGVVAGLYFDAFNTVGIRNGINAQTFRVYNTYTNATNYERLALSANRIAYEYAGFGVSRDLTIQSTGNLVLSAGNSLVFNSALPTQISPLSSTNLTAPNGLTVVTGGGTRGVFAIDQFSHGVYSESGGASIGSGGGQKLVVIYGSMSYFKNNPNRTLFGVNDDGKIFAGRIGSYFTTTPNVSAHVNITTDSTYNSHVTDMLLLSAGPNTSILNYINCVSADRTIFSVNSSGQFNTANIAANKVSINTQGVASTNFIAIESPDGNVIGTNNSGGSYSFVTVNNFAANNGNAPLASARGQWNFPSVVNAPVGISFNNSMYLLNDTSTTQLLGVSSNRATSGLFFYQKANGGAGLNGGSYIITVDNGDDVTHTFGGGNGKTFKIDSSAQGTAFSIRAPSNGHAFTGQVSFSPYSTNQNNIRLLQTAGQTGTFIQAVSSDSITTVFSIVSSGETNINNKIFLKPNGLIQFTNTSSTTPAIKGTSTTVQARTGDDSLS